MAKEEQSHRHRSGAPAVAEPEEFFEAVVRGSVDELLDAGAHTELDAMRHSAAHVMAEAVVGLSSRTPSSASGRRSRTASTTTSCCRGR